MSEKLQALMDLMVPEDESAPFFRGMLYGAEGSAKTVTACSIGAILGHQDGKNTLLIESDPEGWVSLLNHPEINAKVQRMKYQGLSQIEAIAANVLDDVFKPFDTFVIDTTSQIVNSDLDLITERRFKGKKIEEEVPDWPAYRQNKDRIRRAFTDLLRSAPKHIIMTAHARTEKDKTNLSKMTPDMPQGTRNDLTRMCHLVGYMTAEAIEHPDKPAEYLRRTQVHPTKLVVAKSRIGGLTVTVNTDDLPTIIKKWSDAGSKTVDATDLAPESESLLPANVDNSVETIATGLEI